MAKVIHLHRMAQAFNDARSIGNPDSRAYREAEEYCRGKPWERDLGDGRAADASHSSLLHVSTIGGIAIAVLTVAYFLAQLARAVAL